MTSPMALRRTIRIFIGAGLPLDRRDAPKILSCNLRDRRRPESSFILRLMVRDPGLLRIVLLLTICPAVVSQDQPWKVKPEWVRAHEMFLASDALRGRASATPDELLAATYVAAQFERFGIKPGLPDGSYIQRVELTAPVIRGKITIAIPNQSKFRPLVQGKDFVVTRTRGESVSGPLLRIAAENANTAQVQPGAVVLLGGDSADQWRTVFRSLLLAGAKAVLQEQVTNDRTASAQPPSIRPHLPGTEAIRGGLTVLS